MIDALLDETIAKTKQPLCVIGFDANLGELDNIDRVEGAFYSGEPELFKNRPVQNTTMSCSEGDKRNLSFSDR
ncbi:MAG: hypothetical protein KAI17_25465, partial [Thiotrichaceae bacterium]|nr:hypothetical protein [Thiotrichaceae bacterium]